MVTLDEDERGDGMYTLTQIGEELYLASMRMEQDEITVFLLDAKDGTMREVSGLRLALNEEGIVKIGDGITTTKGGKAVLLASKHVM